MLSLFPYNGILCPLVMFGLSVFRLGVLYKIQHKPYLEKVLVSVCIGYVLL